MSRGKRERSNSRSPDRSVRTKRVSNSRSPNRSVRTVRVSTGWLNKYGEPITIEKRIGGENPQNQTPVTKSQKNVEEEELEEEELEEEELEEEELPPSNEAGELLDLLLGVDRYIERPNRTAKEDVQEQQRDDTPQKSRTDSQKLQDHSDQGSKETRKPKDETAKMVTEGRRD